MFIYISDDVAMSLVDGRWDRQKESMLTWSQKYAEVGVKATLIYIVEGDAARYVVTCADGCGGVGRCGHPDLNTVEVSYPYHRATWCEGRVSWGFIS